jgi:lysophospholipase L1-like esterase
MSNGSEFESELLAFDSDHAPLDAAVFYGSSSIRLWDNLAASFPGVSVVNRGFGGSTLAECLHFLPRVIYPLRPSALVLYAADNDLDHGTPSEITAYLFKLFIESIREPFPALPVAFISVKPSPCRFWNIANIRRANDLIRNSIVNHPGVTYLDVFAQMLSPGGGCRPDLFTPDGLHMNPAGYNLWTSVIGSWLNSLSTNNQPPMNSNTPP